MQLGSETENEGTKQQNMIPAPDAHGPDGRKLQPPDHPVGHQT